MKAILAAAISCMIGILGLGGAYSLAGSERAAWPCSERPWEKHCQTTPTVPAISTVTVTTPGSTTPGATVTVTTPAPPAATVTVTTPGPATTTTVTKIKGKPTCAHGDWDITAPRCKPKLIAACKGKYRKEILRWCLRYEASLKPKKKAPAASGNKPREQFHTGAGVTG